MLTFNLNEELAFTYFLNYLYKFNVFVYMMAQIYCYL
jgi:hypothetical protein